MAEARVGCRTPNPDKPGVTNIVAWKFDCIRTAILDELAQADVAWGDLTERVRAWLTPDQLARMGSLGWHVISVKLELEVRGEIARLGGSGAQIIKLKS